jgi:hypothetical protein
MKAFAIKPASAATSKPTTKLAQVSEADKHRILEEARQGQIAAPVESDGSRSVRAALLNRKAIFPWC